MVFEQVRQKLICTISEDGQKLEISDLESIGIVLSVWRKQRRGYRETDLRLCFHICRLLVFFHEAAQFIVIHWEPFFHFLQCLLKCNQ